MTTGFDNTPANRADKYLALMEWARKRYTTPAGLVISKGSQWSVYSRIENAAFYKYLA